MRYDQEGFWYERILFGQAEESAMQVCFILKKLKGFSMVKVGMCEYTI